MIPYAEPVFFGNEEKYVADAMKSKWISGGEYVERFEKSLEEHFKQPVITTSNGTTALELVYLALGLNNRGYDIIVPAFGFMAAANVAYNLGITPIFADVLRDTWNIDPKDVERRINSRTKAIVAIHNYGNPCDMRKLREIATAYNLYLIEDCAEAIFSKHWGQEVGTLGDVATFSFHATKTITTGEGGAVTTNIAGLESFLRAIKNHGLEKRGNYDHTFYGMNYRMTNLQAAIGLAQMENKDKIKELKLNIDWNYCYNFQGDVIFQTINENDDPVFWATALRLSDEYPPRDTVISLMKNYGIEVRPGFLSPTYLSTFDKDWNTPIADKLSKDVISLPCGLSLTDEQINRVRRKMLECREY